MVCLEVIVKNVTMNLQSDGCSKTHLIISIQKLIKNYLLTPCDLHFDFDSLCSEKA